MIDYQKISDAIKHYQHRGYAYIDAPWLASLESINMTRPKGASSFAVSGDITGKDFGHLVASGEQSFLEVREALAVGGKYCCVTPCFRDEKNPDDLHRKYFLKLELIEVLLFDQWSSGKDMEAFQDDLNALGRCYGKGLRDMIDDASDFFKNYVQTWAVETSEGYDLECEGIELGSYGIRGLQDRSFAWIFGTGCAEPRLSQAQAAWNHKREHLLDDQGRRSERPERRRSPARGKEAARRH